MSDQPSTHKRFIAILCRADNGCHACVAKQLAYYCIEFKKEPLDVARDAIDTGIIVDLHEEMLCEWIEQSVNEIHSSSHTHMLTV